jgi:hypothetical protein
MHMQPRVDRSAASSSSMARREKEEEEEKFSNSSMPSRIERDLLVEETEKKPFLSISLASLSLICDATCSNCQILPCRFRTRRTFFIYSLLLILHSMLPAAAAAQSTFFFSARARAVYM